MQSKLPPLRIHCLRHGVAILLVLLMGAGMLPAQSVLFDFDNAPLQSPLPVSLTASGITAHFSGTGQSYSIQSANTLGFTPQGFSGRCIYPSSVFLADLLIRFDQVLTDFSILYACQELACDDAATMRVTAYRNGIVVGTNTKTATFPGTWPSDTLACSFVQGFDSVVVHYDSPPPLCQDYGVIFMADNMRVTPQNSNSIQAAHGPIPITVFPNPIQSTAQLRLALDQPQTLQIAIYDMNGRQVQVIMDQIPIAATNELLLPIGASGLTNGMYCLIIQSEDAWQSHRIWMRH